ncbi:MAG: lipid A biosynthesis acyltransferase [Gammaproteobacteria bacterium]|nr:lipid A biosynthesis acyltransferase [Gammaproteobacteria bacterium]
MQRTWLQQKERGSLLLIRLIGWIALRLGRPLGRLLLYPISFYFVLLVPRARRASRFYLRRVLGHTPRFSELFHHVHTFAATILDRVYLITNRLDHFDITIHGYPELLAQYHRGKGCLMMGSHLGSFELLRSLASKEDGVVFHALMHEANAEKVGRVLNALNPEIKETVIPVGRSDTLFRVQAAMERGEVVGILGDRVALDDKVVECQFFGETCEFPAGPLLVAGLLQVPVFMFFGVYVGGRRYEIHFEILSEGFSLERKNRMQQVQAMTQLYVERLEHYCRRYPYNWFNFYNFWNDRG